MEQLDPDDPGAVVALKKTYFDSDYLIRRKAVSISYRFLPDSRVLTCLQLTAGCANEHPETRLEAFDQLEPLFNPLAPDSRSEQALSEDQRRELRRFFLSLTTDPFHEIQMRARALEIVSWFSRGPRLNAWILYFYNRPEAACRESALTAMGRGNRNRWKSYLISHINDCSADYREAARRALTEPVARPEQVEPFPSTLPPFHILYKEILQ